MPAKEVLAYISLPRCGSKLARSSASPSTNSLLIPWLHEQSQSAFQSSNPIGQFINICIRAVALTTP